MIPPDKRYRLLPSDRDVSTSPLLVVMASSVIHSLLFFALLQLCVRLTAGLRAGEKKKKTSRKVFVVDSECVCVWILLLLLLLLFPPLSLTLSFSSLSESIRAAAFGRVLY